MSTRSKNKPEVQKRTRAQATTPQYTKAQKIKAIAAMRIVGQDHPYGALAVAAAQGVLGTTVSISTLKHWMDTLGPELDQVAPELAIQPIDMSAIGNDTRERVISNMQQSMVKLSDHINSDEIIGKTSVRDAGVTFGILFDKMAKLASVTPEEEQAIHRLRLVSQRAGRDHIKLVNRLADKIEAESRGPLTVDVSE